MLQLMKFVQLLLPCACIQSPPALLRPPAASISRQGLSSALPCVAVPSPHQREHARPINNTPDRLTLAPAVSARPHQSHGAPDVARVPPRLRRQRRRWATLEPASWKIRSGGGAGQFGTAQLGLSPACLAAVCDGEANSSVSSSPL